MIDRRQFLQLAGLTAAFLALFRRFAVRAAVSIPDCGCGDGRLPLCLPANLPAAKRPSVYTSRLPVIIFSPVANSGGK